MMRKFTVFLLGFLGVSLMPFSGIWRLPFVPGGGEQTIAYATADSLLFLEKQKLASKDQTTAVRTLAIAESFLGTPYVHGCLECEKEEQLTINLRQLDCWTFVENSVAIALTEDGSFGVYETFLQQLRYWGGHIDGYGSRIHYFTGWLLQAEKCGLLDNLTESMGGIPYKKQIGYISARPAKYPKIRDEKALKGVQSGEKRINTHPWFYIPQEKIAKMEHLIEEGDIVCLTAFKPDLDIAHQGFAVKLKGRVYLMHASSLEKKVIVSRQPLADYVLSQPGQTGIMVARLRNN
jgi:hypothetical protein